MLVNKGIDSDVEGIRRKNENLQRKITPSMKRVQRGAASLAESELNKKFSKKE